MIRGLMEKHTEKEDGRGYQVAIQTQENITLVK
jgi:hypothetical protein